MQITRKIFLLTLLSCFSGVAYGAGRATADGLRKSCEPFRSESKPSLDKAFCRGYLDGWKAALEGEEVADDKGVMQTATFGSTVTADDMGKAFLVYMDNHPEEKDAIPKIALMHAMVSGGIVKLSPVEKDQKK